MIKRGCKPREECTEAEHFTDEPPGKCTNNPDGGMTCLMCDYFMEEPSWCLCEKPPGMQNITARLNQKGLQIDTCCVGSQGIFGFRNIYLTQGQSKAKF